MMKIVYTLLFLLTVAVVGIGGYSMYENFTKSETSDLFAEVEEDNSVESYIKKDKQLMTDSIAKDYVFFESRIILAEPFNESDSFVIAQIINVFQTNVRVSKTDIFTTVYLIVHDMNTGSTEVDIHPNAFVWSDLELNMDSVKVRYKDAFEKARESNFAPPKSKYITLRHYLGRYPCNPFYSFGNDQLGHLWVDAVTGEVMDKDPSTIEK